MPFDSAVHSEYLKTLDAQAAGIKEAFSRQQAKAAVRLHVYFVIINILIAKTGGLGPREVREASDRMDSRLRSAIR